MRRAREWTHALGRWWAQQQDMLSRSRAVASCIAPRSSSLDGSWSDALEAARRAGERFVETKNPSAGLAHYRQGEVLRLQGEFAGAETAYRGRRAGSGGSRIRVSPSCGLRRVGATMAAIRRANTETTAPLKRAGLLPAYVEIMVTVGEIEEARSACRELEQIATSYESAMLGGMVAHAGGGRVGAWRCRRCSRRAAPCRSGLGRALEAPYESARTRELIAQACRDLGDEDTGTMELEAARGIFEQLRATPGSRTTRSAASVERDPRALAARARGAPPRRRGKEQSRDRVGARDQRAYRCPPPPEHLREARPVVPHRGGSVRLRERSRLSGEAWGQTPEVGPLRLIRRVVRNDYARI